MDGYSGATYARPSDPSGPSFPRNSYYSHHSVAPSTQSWVYDHHQKPPGPPPPQPVDLPSPVQTLRPLQNLPNPHHHALHVINRDPMAAGEDDYMHAGAVPRRIKRPGKTNSDSEQTDYGPAIPRPRKKKSFVGGFVKGIRKLPKAVFGYGSSASSGKNALELSGTLDMEDTPTEGTGTALPGYSSNPLTPVAEVRPSRSNLYRRERPTAVSPIPESPPPEVVRLSASDVPQRNSIHGNNLPGGFEPGPSGSQLFAPQGPRFVENLRSEDSFGNPNERTTVMLYHDPDSQPYNRNSRGPLPTPPVTVPQVSSPGLSYVSDPPPAPLTPFRPSSFQEPHERDQPQLQGSAEIPRIGSGSTISQKVPKVSPPQRVPPPSLLPGGLHSSHTPSQQSHQESRSQSRPQPQQAEPQQQPQSPPRNAEPPPIEPIQSPVDAHPDLAPDYREMTLGSSPSSPDRALTTRHGKSHYDPSFSSELSPVERFFKTLYRMPWVSHDRVTVDYKPGIGLGHMKKKKTKPLSSWYRSMLAGSRRSSATLDLLSSSNRTGTDRTSLSLAVAAAIAGPLAASRHSGRSSEDRRRGHHDHHHHRPQTHHHHHRHHSPHHHRHHEKSKHGRRRRTTSSAETTDTEADDKYPSPLLSPLPFPMPYPSFPYPSYPSYPIAPAAIPTQVQSPPKPTGDNTVPSPASPRFQQPPQLMTYAPAGYASYQPMVAPSPVYLFQTALPAHVNASVVQPAVHPAAAQQAHSQEQQQAQAVAAPSGVVHAPSIPGAFP